MRYELTRHELLGESFQSDIDTILNREMYNMLCTLQNIITVLDIEIQEEVQQDIIPAVMHNDHAQLSDILIRDLLVVMDFHNLLTRLQPEFLYLTSLLTSKY